MPSLAVRPGRRAGLRALLCCVLVCCVPAATMSGCSMARTVRHPPPDGGPPQVATPSPALPSGPRLPDRFEARTVRVPVPADDARVAVDFADGRRGAALFVRCDTSDREPIAPGRCRARLLVTADGGRSWQARAHPGPVAVNHELRVGYDGTLVLLAEPNAWFVSRDAGSSFRRLPYALPGPAEYLAADGPYQICCDGDVRPRLVRWQDGRSTAVGPPPLPGDLAAVVSRTPGELWAASIDAALPYTAVSRDDGRTWTRYAVPGADNGLRAVQLRASSNGSDLWLLGVGGDRLRPPSVWRFDGMRWQQMAAQGRPRSSIASVPIGAGLLAVTGVAGTGLLAERYTPVKWPAGNSIRLLADGTVQVNDPSDDSVWLGTGIGVRRTWARLQLLRS